MSSEVSFSPPSDTRASTCVATNLREKKGVQTFGQKGNLDI
jgi:hypothetical protein